MLNHRHHPTFLFHPVPDEKNKEKESPTRGNIRKRYKKNSVKMT